MSQTLRRPQVYRRGPWMRLVEGLRYGGGIGQWSWLVHRLTGLGILIFLIIHIIDTFFVVASPGLYDETVAIYGGRWPWVRDPTSGLPVYLWQLRWAFRLGELGLIASVLFHSINGVRIVLFDFWPGASRHQKRIFAVAMILFLAIMIPVSIRVFMPLMDAPEPWPLIEDKERAEIVAAPPAAIPGPVARASRVR